MFEYSMVAIWNSKKNSNISKTFFDYTCIKVFYYDETKIFKANLIFLEFSFMLVILFSCLIVDLFLKLYFILY